MSAAASNVLEEQRGEVEGPFKQLRRRMGQGDIGSLPVIIGLIAIWAIFHALNSNFLTPRNLSNLVLQIAAMGIISAGVVPVLLLGEIDLSIGAVSGLAAGVMGVMSVNAGVPAPVAIGSGILVGALIGALQGFWFVRFSVPSFVVTLAGLLAWQGGLLFVLGSTGTVNLSDPGITGLAGTFLPHWLGILIAAVSCCILIANLVADRRRRKKLGLTTTSTAAEVIRMVLILMVTVVALVMLQADRGVPLAIVILLLVITCLDFLTQRTRFGRYIFALGGNVEASRRAGIPVGRIRVTVYIMCSTLAACGGIMASSRLLAVNQSSGSGDVLLNAIAAAVIGGTSLFGGRGSVWAALTGALVIGSISNGMDLLALSSAMKFMITGAVLLVAVTIDAVTRQGRQAAGRA